MTLMPCVKVNSLLDAARVADAPQLKLTPGFPFSRLRGIDCANISNESDVTALVLHRASSSACIDVYIYTRSVQRATAVLNSYFQMQHIYALELGDVW